MVSYYCSVRGRADLALDIFNKGLKHHPNDEDFLAGRKNALNTINLETELAKLGRIPGIFSAPSKIQLTLHPSLRGGGLIM